MAADPILVCLREVTDYAQFERLCSDLMVLEDFPKLEPLGGFKDKGRDAVHICRSSGRTTIFAYSVREDWRKKLEEDAGKIRNHGHTCDELVFLSTATPTAGERDKAVQEVADAYGWDIELFGLERLSGLLRSKHRHLIGAHPQIFTPAYFPPVYAGVDPEQQDFVFIDYVDPDEVLALWIARRLMAAGYRPWCRALSLFPGERPANVMENVIRNHSARVLLVCSPKYLANPDAHSRRAMAHGLATERGSAFVIPIRAEPFDASTLDSRTHELEFAPFERSSAEGLERLLTTLTAGSCPRPLEGSGPSLATQTMKLPGLVRSEPERIYSNCFPIVRVPEVLHVFSSREPVDRDLRRELSGSWAFRTVGEYRLISMQGPPAEIESRLGVTQRSSACWRDCPKVEDIDSRDLVLELLRKSLLVHCAERGLAQRHAFDLLHFPRGLTERDRLNFIRPDGTWSWLNCVGERSLNRRGSRVTYRYHLAPHFRVRSDFGDRLVAVLKVRVHLTDDQGEPLPSRITGSRRRKLFKGWYNYEWLSRTLAIAQFLADGGERIEIGGHPDERIEIECVPLNWESPVSLDESLLTSIDEDEPVMDDFDEEEVDDAEDEE